MQRKLNDIYVFLYFYYYYAGFQKELAVLCFFLTLEIRFPNYTGRATGDHIMRIMSLFNPKLNGFWVLYVEQKYVISPKELQIIKNKEMANDKNKK